MGADYMLTHHPNNRAGWLILSNHAYPLSMFQPIRMSHVIVSTYSTDVSWSHDQSRLFIHIMWSIPQSCDIKGRRLKAINTVSMTMEWIEEGEPQQMFQVDDMTKEHPIYEQDEAMLKPWVDHHNLKKVNCTWYKDGRWVVTNNLEHWRTLIQSHHNLPVYGHLRKNWTICLLERYYWWPGVQKEATAYIKGCAESQWHKVNNCPTWAVLSPMNGPGMIMRLGFRTWSLIYPMPEALLLRQ